MKRFGFISVLLLCLVMLVSFFSQKLWSDWDCFCIDDDECEDACASYKEYATAEILSSSCDYNYCDAWVLVTCFDLEEGDWYSRKIRTSEWCSDCNDFPID